MTEKIDAVMSEQDWQNLRAQLKVLVDVYCEMNNDILNIKVYLKNLVKILKKQQSKEKLCTKKKTAEEIK